MKKPALFITLYHHRHGTSFSLITADDEADAKKKAEQFWINTDGMEPDPADRDELDYFEVGPAGDRVDGYDIVLVKRRKHGRRS